MGRGYEPFLALPSNSCKEFMGQKIGDRVVDKWGAEVSCAKFPEGSFIRRHDRIKLCISSLATYCGMDFICEPQSIFTAHIPQRPLRPTRSSRVLDLTLFSRFPLPLGSTRD